MKKLVAAFLIFISVSLLQAQVPGYKGKLIVVSGEYLCSPSIFFPNKNFNNRKLNFQGINGIKADITVSRNVSLGIGVHSYKTGLIHYSIAQYDYDNYDYDFSGGANDEYTTFYHLVGKEISSYIKIFSFNKRGSIAPVGTYNELAVHVGQVGNKHLVGYRAVEDKDFAITYGVAAWTLGFRNIYFKRIITDIGFRTALPTLKLFSFGTSGSNSTVGSYSKSFYLLEDELKVRGRAFQVFNLKVGIGILL